jgi:NDP-sugar pyrophosphorylase family protein
MVGFILAAGLGTRLRPLTNDRPKALVEINGVTLLERTIRRLEAANVKHIVVNVHHFADKVIDFIKSHTWQAAIDISDERELLLDTGGGLKKAAALFSGRENVLVHNVDILSDIDLQDLERHHKEQKNLVTLCVSQRQTKRMLAFDESGLFLGRAESLPPAAKSINPSLLAFSGISVVSPELFALLPEADHPYPVIDEYIRLSREGYRIGSYVHSPDHWLDVGKPETLEIAKRWTLS